MSLNFNNWIIDLNFIYVIYMISISLILNPLQYFKGIREFYSQRTQFQVVSELDLTVSNSDTDLPKDIRLFCAKDVCIKHLNVFYNEINFLKNLLACLYLGASTHGCELGKPICTNSIIYRLNTSSPVMSKNLASTYISVCIIWLVIYKLLIIALGLPQKQKKKKKWQEELSM